MRGQMLSEAGQERKGNSPFQLASLSEALWCSSGHGSSQHLK